MNSQELHLWNMSHPIGTLVEAKFRDGDTDPRPNPLSTKTRGTAFLTNEGVPMVTVAGIDYAVALADITVVKSANGLTDLADYSRQVLQVGTPPVSIYTGSGARPSQDIIQLTLLARATDALERIALALEGNEGRDVLAESVRIYGGGQGNG